MGGGSGRGRGAEVCRAASPGIGILGCSNFSWGGGEINDADSNEEERTLGIWLAGKGFCFKGLSVAFFGGPPFESEII